MASGYERQVRPGGGGYDLARADAETFGGSFGRATQQAGQVLSAREDAAGRRYLESAALDYGVKAAEFRARRTQAIADAKLNAGPGGAGHTDAVLKDFDTDRETLLGGISNRRVRDKAMADFAELRSGIEADAHVFEAGQRVAKGFVDLDQQARVGANRVAVDPSPKVWGEELDALYASVTAMSGPDDAKTKFLRGKEGELTVAFLQALPAQQRKVLIEGGAVSAYLDPAQLTAIREGADVDIRQEEARARSALVVEKAEARDKVEGVERLIRDGVPVPDADIDAALGLAGQYGLDASSYGLGTAKIRNRLTRTTAAYTPADYEREIGVLSARIANAGDSPKPDDVIARDHLVDLQRKRGAELKENPAAWAAGIGMQLAPIDFNDPATVTPAAIATRGRQMRAVSTETRTPLKLLTPAEAAPLADAVANGNATQRFEAAQRIGLFGRDGEAVLRQVAPNDTAFQIATRLSTVPDGGAAMRDAFMGPDALKVAPNLLKPDDGSHPVDVFSDGTAAALKALPPSYRAGVMETAQNIYASRMGRSGLSSWNEGRYRGGIQTALGMYNVDGVQHGGIGLWHEKPVLLPANMTQDDFDKRLSRSSAAAVVAAAGGQPPVWNDGRVVLRGEFLSMTPVAVGDGIYKFETGNGYLRRKGGGEFRLDIRKVAR